MRWIVVASVLASGCVGGVSDQQICNDYCSTYERCIGEPCPIMGCDFGECRSEELERLACYSQSCDHVDRRLDNGTCESEASAWADCVSPGG